MKDYYPSATKEVDRPPRGPVEAIEGVCSSQILDEVLQDPNAELKVSYKVPESEAAKYVSVKTTGMEHPPEDLVIISDF